MILWVEGREGLTYVAYNDRLCSILKRFQQVKCYLPIKGRSQMTSSLAYGRRTPFGPPPTRFGPAT